MRRDKLDCFLRQALRLLAGMACGAMLLLNIIYLSQVQYDASEKVILNWDFPFSAFLLVAVALLAAILSQLEDEPNKVNQRKLFCILSALYTGFALYLILNVEPLIRADAGAVHTTAKQILAGDYYAFQKGGYLYRHPHQLGLALYDCLLALFSPNPLWNMVVNFLLVLGINYTTFRISQELFQNRASSLLTMLCSFAFLPQLFFILFVYGMIPGLFCMVSAFYQTLRFTREKKIKNLIALVLFCAGAVVLKSNYAIGIIAIFIYLGLQLLKEKINLKMAAALISLLLCLVVPSRLVTMGFEAVTGSPTDQGIPMNLYLAMGTNIDNWIRGAGWYDNSHNDVYDEAWCDKEEAGRVGMELLRENLEKIRRQPKKALDFLQNKTISQWCDPLYQSLWSGPLEAVGQKTYTRITESLYCDGLAEDAMTVLCKYVSLLIWVGTIAFLILRGTRTQGWELFLMYFLGGLIFHTFWEGKSQYIYPYVFCLIPCAMAGIWELSRRMRRFFKNKPTAHKKHEFVEI